MANILLIEPYYSGSHRAWADELQKHSRHHITLLTMPAQFWKWRMQGGAITMARLYVEHGHTPDLILATDMMNLATFRALVQPSCPIVLYFHENQLTYPQNSRQKHGWQYGFVNAISALTADRVLFSSQYHHDAFFDALPRMLKHFADYNELQIVDQIREQSRVVSLAIDLRQFDGYRHERNPGEPPLILWNHRWEEDKNPELFADALTTLHRHNHDFRVAIVGEPIRQSVPEFAALRDQLGDKVVQYGYQESFADYASWLWRADYVISTAVQEFFGIAVTQAMYCGCIPILPNRLNYPHLIPDDLKSRCLYRHDGALIGTMRAHLTGTHTINNEERAQLRAHIAQFDWSRRIAEYDATFDALLKT